MGNKRVRRLAVLAIVAVTALSGCIKSDVNIYVADDDTADIDMDMAIDKQLLEMFGAFAEPEEAVGCAAFTEDAELPDDEGVTVETSEDDNWCYLSLVAQFDSVDELITEMSETDSDDEAGAGGSGDINITVSDGVYRFEVGDLGLQPDPEDPFAEMTERFSEDLEMNFTIRLPGRPVDHNADRVEGNTFIWHLEWGDERDTIFAETEPGDPDDGSTSRDDFAALAAESAAANPNSGPDDTAPPATTVAETAPPTTAETAPSTTTVAPTETTAVTEAAPAGTDAEAAPADTEAASATTVAAGADDDAEPGEATDDADDGGSSTIWIVLIVLALLALGGIAYLFVRSRNDGPTPPSTPATPTPPSEMPPPPPPSQ